MNNTTKALKKRQQDLERGTPVTIGKKFYWVEWHKYRGAKGLTEVIKYRQTNRTDEYIFCDFEYLKKLHK